MPNQEQGTNNSKTAQLWYYDDALDVWVPVGVNTPMPVSATFSGTITIGQVDQGAPNTLANAWPVSITDGLNVLGTLANPIHVISDSTSSGTVTVVQPTGSNLHVVIDSSAAVTFSQPVEESINISNFDLQASSFSQTTSIPQDFRLDSIRLIFNTAALKTITITDSSGLILWGGNKDNSYKNLGYNTTSTDFNLIANQEFNGNDNITIDVTQTLAPCLVSCKVNTTFLT